MAEKRLRYYNGQFLQEQDFTAEQEYHLDRQRRHNRQLHTYGIAEGLTVTAGVGATSAVVSPGTAVDGEGRTIVLTESRNVPFNGLTGAVLVVISYAQQTSDPATVGDEGNTRWWERPDLEVIAEAGAPAADVRIRLARLQIAGNNTVSSHDTNVRTSAGVKLGTEVSIERIRVSRQGVDQAQWPVLTSGAAGRADLAGNLSVTGNITVTGTVDGRDVSTDGTNLDNHRNRTDNPHSVTATQVGALTSIGGVSNPGGGITLAGQTGITITPNDAANSITFAGGAPISIDGVSNPGGNIDFVGQGGISITPDNTGKLIAFNTSPAAIGALPASDYLRRVVTYTSFATNESTKPINCGFLPRHISVHFTIWGSFAAYYHTIYPTGVVSVSSTSSWTSYGSLHYVRRYNSIPYWESWGYSGYTALATADFYDYVSSPSRHANVAIVLDSVSNSGFTLRVDRYTNTADMLAIYIYCQISILG